MKSLVLILAAAATLAGVSATQAQSKVSDAVVRIGVLTDMSGPYSDLAGKGSLTAAQMAVEDFGGKVLGAPVDVDFADHLNKPDVAANIAREWFDTKQVDAVVDLAGSPVSLAVMELAKQQNRIAFVTGSGTSRITNDACNANTVHTSWDSYSQSYSIVNAVYRQGGHSWFFITLDNAGGKSVEKDATDAVIAAGGKVLGQTRFPLGSPDFSSYILQAQASKANVVAFIGNGADTVNAAKAASEFGVAKGGQTLVALTTLIPEIHSIGLAAAQGMTMNEAFYWDYDEQTRKFARRFFARMQKMPNSIHAGIYSSVTNYLKAVQAAGTDEAKAVMTMLKKTPINDLYARHGRIREDGRMVLDMYLVQVKKPSESKYPWDYYTVKAVVPAEQAFQPLSKSTCPLVKKG
jgi:branched-chain amino acid transport system substrate-binding protein